MGSILHRIGVAFGLHRGLWPKQTDVPPPAADGSYARLASAALAQLDHAVEALPGWNGVKDASVESRCTYGHTHIKVVLVRTDELAVPLDQRKAAARRAMREILAAYCERALPGDGFEQHRACGDSQVTIEVKWVV